MKLYRLVVAGGRYFSDYELLVQELDKVLEDKLGTHEIVIVSGKAKGADYLGEMYAKEKGYKVHSYPAKWDKHGRSAGYIRNADMAKNSEAVIVFWDGESRGTKHMKELAEKSNKLVRVVDY